MNTASYIQKTLGLPLPDTSKLVSIDTPFTLIVAWDVRYKLNKIKVHPVIADPLKAVLQDLLLHYGIDEIKRLRINYFGGCHAFRRKRNSNQWSSHAWAIALDLDPINNQLSYKKNKATFAKPEYKAMIDIFYKHGFYNLGEEEGYDYMHFEYDLNNLKKQ